MHPRAEGIAVSGFDLTPRCPHMLLPPPSHRHALGLVGIHGVSGARRPGPIIGCPICFPANRLERRIRAAVLKRSATC